MCPSIAAVLLTFSIDRAGLYLPPVPPVVNMAPVYKAKLDTVADDIIELLNKEKEILEKNKGANQKRIEEINKHIKRIKEIRPGGR